MSETLTFSGKGSSVNKFNMTISKFGWNFDTINKYHVDDWYRFHSNTANSLFQNYRQFYNDSTDTNFDYFSELIYNNLRFTGLDLLMHKAWLMLDSLPTTVVNDYVNSNTDSTLINNISDRRYLLSSSYRETMGVSFWYLFYLVKYDEKLHFDSTRSKYQIYLDKITQLFKDEVRDYVLYKFLSVNLVASVNSYERFQQRCQITMPYLNNFKGKQYYDRLARAIQQKGSELARLKAGDPAPTFSLIDSSGRHHELSDFRRKIVLLDFWASWCGPCRMQTPFLAMLYDKYKKDNRVTFISIAVRDKKGPWVAALENDRPGWLQLFDRDGKTASDYFTNAIPKFVVINGEGTIVDFQAPAPDEGDKLERLIESCIRKMK